MPKGVSRKLSDVQEELSNQIIYSSVAFGVSVVEDMIEEVLVLKPDLKLKDFRKVLIEYKSKTESKTHA